MRGRVKGYGVWSVLCCAVLCLLRRKKRDDG